MDGLTWASIAGAAVALGLAAVLLARVRRARRPGGLERTRPGEASSQPEGRQVPAATAAEPAHARHDHPDRSVDRPRPVAGGAAPSYEERHSAHWQDGRPELSEPEPDPGVEGVPDARERIERLRERRQDQAGIGGEDGDPDRGD